jgi:RNA polymerase sigma-70 factor (ECF subfamily)
VCEPGDRELVDRLRRGEPGAFDTAYACYRASMYAFLFRLSGRRDVADDLFQDTFLKLARFAPALRADTDLAAWLFTVARNAYRSHRRWAMLDLSRLATLADEPRSTEVAPLADASVDGTQRLLRVDGALARLSPNAREALLLVCVEGFSQERAARVVGVTYPAFRQRLARAREELRGMLERDESSPPR